MIWPGVTMCPMLPEQIDAYRAQPVPKDGHISVTLDFIPVTERLPENPREVFAFVDGSLRRCHYLESGRGMEWKICGKATYFSKGLVTHWAEIPAIKEVKP